MQTLPAVNHIFILLQTCVTPCPRPVCQAEDNGCDHWLSPATTAPTAAYASQNDSHETLLQFRNGQMHRRNRHIDIYTDPAIRVTGRLINTAVTATPWQATLDRPLYRQSANSPANPTLYLLQPEQLLITLEHTLNRQQGKLDHRIYASGYSNGVRFQRLPVHCPTLHKQLNHHMPALGCAANHLTINQSATPIYRYKL